jgi:hypothetical protein
LPYAQSSFLFQVDSTLITKCVQTAKTILELDLVKCTIGNQVIVITNISSFGFGVDTLSFIKVGFDCKPVASNLDHNFDHNLVVKVADILSHILNLVVNTADIPSHIHFNFTNTVVVLN